MSSDTIVMGQFLTEKPRSHPGCCGGNVCLVDEAFVSIEENKQLVDSERVDVCRLDLSPYVTGSKDLVFVGYGSWLDSKGWHKHPTLPGIS